MGHIILFDGIVFMFLLPSMITPQWSQQFNNILLVDWWSTTKESLLYKLTKCSKIYAESPKSFATTPVCGWMQGLSCFLSDTYSIALTHGNQNGEEDNSCGKIISIYIYSKSYIRYRMISGNINFTWCECEIQLLKM